jgi:hypothetical protein
MDTERLIRTLAQDVEPVTPIPPPLRRAAAWAGVAGIYLLLLVVVVPPRVDPAGRLRDVGFLLEQGAAVVTGITAAFAALAYSIPGYRRSIVWLPIASAFAWITVVGGRAVQEVPLSVAALPADWRCVPATLIGAALPAGVLALMLRRGVPLAPRSTGALAGLAAAGLGNIGICFFHPHHSNLAILVWHVGTVLVVTAIAGMTSAKLLRWPARGMTLASR